MGEETVLDVAGNVELEGGHAALASGVSGFMEVSTGTTSIGNSGYFALPAAQLEANLDMSVLLLGLATLEREAMCLC